MHYECCINGDVPYVDETWYVCTWVYNFYKNLGSYLKILGATRKTRGEVIY
jgi:hypothetical protein